MLEEVNNLRKSAETEKELEALRPVLKEIAHLDHDINTPFMRDNALIGQGKKIRQGIAE